MKYDTTRKIQTDTKEYEEFVTSSHYGDYLTPSFYGNALSEEVGELNGKIKRLLRGDYGVKHLIDAKIDFGIEGNKDFRKMALLEAGDVLNYLTGFIHKLNSNLSEVIQMNYDKLADRHNRGVVKGSGDVR